MTRPSSAKDFEERARKAKVSRSIYITLFDHTKYSFIAEKLGFHSFSDMVVRMLHYEDKQDGFRKYLKENNT